MLSKNKNKIQILPRTWVALNKSNSGNLKKCKKKKPKILVGQIQKRTMKRLANQYETTYENSPTELYLLGCVKQLDIRKLEKLIIERHILYLKRYQKQVENTLQLTKRI